MYKVFVFGNNWICSEALKLITRHVEVSVVGVCLNDISRQKSRDEILKEMPEEAEVLVYEPESFDITSLPEADLGFCFSFGHILPKEVIAHFPKGIINLHPSYLPYNRGSAANVFSIVNDYPAGVSLHYVNASVDSGAIVAQKKVEVESVDTGKSMYRKLEVAGLELFAENFKSILSGNFKAKSNDWQEYPINTVKKMYAMDRLNLEENYQLRGLINVLRARTFDSYPGAYFFDDEGRKVFVRINLEYEAENLKS